MTRALKTLREYKLHPDTIMFYSSVPVSNRINTSEYRHIIISVELRAFQSMYLQTVLGEVKGRALMIKQ